MRTLLLSAVLIIPAITIAAAEGESEGRADITRYGTWLLVSAPVTETELPKGLSQLKVTVRFVDTPATEVADFVRRTAGVNVVVAPTVTANPPLVNLDVTGMNLGNLLHWTARQTGLRWQLRDGALYLTDRAEPGPRQIRIYDIADLLITPRDCPGPELAMNAPAKGSGGGMQLLAPVEQEKAAPTADDVVEMLQHLLALKAQR